MPRKLAAKLLTASDLTLFSWHFKNENAGNQKALNLNRGVFVDALYPMLPEIAQKKDGRILVSVNLYGPGLKEQYNMTRKIIKGDAYKNWRLNGEFINNPVDDPDRFNILKPGDVVVLDFEGAQSPDTVNLFFLASGITEDNALHQALAALIGEKKMVALSDTDIAKIIEDVSAPQSHPIRNLLIDAALEDAAGNGINGIIVLQDLRTRRKVTKTEIERARETASQIGQLGEELVDGYLEVLRKKGDLKAVEWTSSQNAVAPYDFQVVEQDGRTVNIEVKATGGDFDRDFHVSMSELKQMALGVERHDLYRLFEVGDGTARLRIASGVKSFACKVLDTIKSLPDGITVDSFSVNPGILDFGDVIELVPTVANADEE